VAKPTATPAGGRPAILEDDKMEVYAVFSGCYSDRQLDAIFKTRELAEEYIRHEKKFGGPYRGVDDDIIVYELNSKIKIKYCYFLFNYDDNSFEPCADFWKFGNPNQKDDVTYNKVVGECVRVRVKYNKDFSVCEKSAIDKYFAWKAMQEGLI
jgi:hypothetical protein